jgi:hypothetical protein
MKAPVAAPLAAGPADAQAQAAYALSSDTSRRQRDVWNNVSKIQDKLSRALNAPVVMAESRSSLQLSLENEKLKDAQAAYVKALQAAGETDGDVIGYVFAVNGKLTAPTLSVERPVRKMWPAHCRQRHRDRRQGLAAARRCSTTDVLAFLGAAGHGKGDRGSRSPSLGGGLETRRGRPGAVLRNPPRPCRARRRRRLGAWNYLAK